MIEIGSNLKDVIAGICILLFFAYFSKKLLG